MPADLTISSLSLEYVAVPVQAFMNGAPYNPTGDAVQMGFVPSGSAVPSVWYAAIWQTSVNSYLALCLVGPGGTVTLAEGTYTVWVKITDNPEIPVKPSGTLTVT